MIVLELFRTLMEALDREHMAQQRAHRLRRVLKREKQKTAQLRRQQSALCEMVDQIEGELAESRRRLETIISGD